MEVFGFTIARTKALRTATQQALAQLGTNLGGRGGWYPIIREPYTGAWQRNDELRVGNVLGYSVVYACVTLISSDIAKLRIKLVQEDADEGITEEIENPAYSPVLRKPNDWQNRIKFLEQWIISKLLFGNTYVLKARDRRGVVVALYVLDPARVTPAVSPDGQVFYQLATDNLAGLSDQVTVPASELIHDVMVPLYHPLCGVSPITACGLSAMQGLYVQGQSSAFFANGANPSGVLTAPGHIPPELVERLKATWTTEFTGDNAGKVAILGDGLKFEAMSIKAADAQLIEQLKWTGQDVCTAFRVPSYMVGVGPPPSYNNVEALQQQYYTQCLQYLIECVELLLDEGLALPSTLYTELDLDALLRMDTAAKTKATADLIGAGAWAPNEARRRWFNLRGVEGGETPYLQQQNFSLAALAKRDAQPDPFATSSTAAVPAPKSLTVSDEPREAPLAVDALAAMVGELLREELHA